MLPDPIRSPALLVPHGFFTRLGGVSAGPFASLNCSLSSADDRNAVLENRARAARAIGAEPGALLGLTQVHGALVVHATSAWAAGQGPRADAMVADRPDIALGIITADCAPVLFCDAAAGVVGAAHAGWRGAVAGVLEATVAAMRGLGARHIAAAIGPCIRQESYEVGADLRDAVLARDPADDRFFAPGRREARWQFDLAGYCAARLEAAGVAVAVLEADTMADEARFFSHRRRTLSGGGPIGHQVSAIRLGGQALPTG
ncbi:MAG TPA: peptidoglycan editing factor PgeF [Acetobacteraceae bacterium]|nr:peptidoglycan editing factor PgeF [Acetobacteraceae bacterium]